MDVEPGNPDHYIIMTGYGGVWRTLDNGTTWSHIFDAEGIGLYDDVAIDPSNSSRYLVGTLDGLYETTDGGTTWTEIFSGVARHISFDPTDPDIIIMIGHSGSRHVYRSTDGGSTWNITYNDVPFVDDIDFIPGNSDIIFLTIRGNSNMISGFLKSTDNGLTWSEFSNGSWLDDSVLRLATSIDDPNYLYVLEAALVTGDWPEFAAIHKSVDQGMTWTTTYDGNLITGQMSRDQCIVVSPDDKDLVHTGSLDCYKSLDGGTVWSTTTDWTNGGTLPFVHADISVMEYHDNILYVCSDGGIFKSTDNAVSFTDHSIGLGIREIYTVSVSRGAIDHLATGTQDNGTSIYNDLGWKDFAGGDGMGNHMLHSNPNLVVGSIQWGKSIFKTLNGGVSSSFCDQNGSEWGHFVFPLVGDSEDNLYKGGNEVYKLNNENILTSSGSGCEGWTAISNFPNIADDNKLKVITVAPSDSDVIIASFGRRFYRTFNGGDSWNELFLPSIPGQIYAVDIHPDDPLKTLVSYNKSGTPKVVESENGGASWSFLSDPLPNALRVSSVVYEGGPDNGIYMECFQDYIIKVTQIQPGLLTELDFQMFWCGI